MPTVPEVGEYMGALDAQQRSKMPTPEHVLMTAADMKARGQLTMDSGSFKSPGANLKLPFPGGRSGSRPARSQGKRR